MINVALELQDKNLKGLDFSFPENGNPGIGGSEWLFLMLARYLQIYFPKEYRISIYHYSNCKIPEGIKDIHIESEDDLLEILETSGDQIIIHQIAKEKSWYQKISRMDIIDIPWAHCYIKYNEVMAINQCVQVKRVVFVGREEFDSYMDDDIIEKSVYIYNMVNTKKQHKVRKENFSKTVTYLGSLVPEKSFHRLAEIWPEILKQVPEAKMQVIGTGKLYDRNAQLGKFGIAQKEYEDYFMRFLTDESGNILPSVNFLGLVGAEKENYFIESAVGVVNPSGIEETFCLSAVEMELCGVPIVTKRKYGLLDTVSHKKTGLLFRTRKEFIYNIVRLLQDKELNYFLGNNAKVFVINYFEAEKIVFQWHQLFQNILNGHKVSYIKPVNNYKNDLKWLRAIIRKIRFDMGCRIIPSVNKTKYVLKCFLKRI